MPEIPAQITGWKRLFLSSLGEFPHVGRAAQAAGQPRDFCYRERDADPVFRLAWQEAIEFASDTAEEEVWRRAVKGVPEPIYYQGVQCGETRRYSDGLLARLLAAHRPDKWREHKPDRQAEDVDTVQIRLVPRPKVVDAAT